MSRMCICSCLALQISAFTFGINKKAHNYFQLEIIRNNRKLWHGTFWKFFTCYLMGLSEKVDGASKLDNNRNLIISDQISERSLNMTAIKATLTFHSIKCNLQLKKDFMRWFVTISIHIIYIIRTHIQVIHPPRWAGAVCHVKMCVFWWRVQWEWKRYTDTCSSCQQRKDREKQMHQMGIGAWTEGPIWQMKRQTDGKDWKKDVQKWQGSLRRRKAEISDSIEGH